MYAGSFLNGILTIAMSHAPSKAARMIKSHFVCGMLNTRRYKSTIENLMHATATRYVIWMTYKVLKKFVMLLGVANS